MDIDQSGIHVKIKVVGVGGGGCNAVNTMIRSNLSGVEFVTSNTDKQVLDASLASTKIAIGQDLTKGLGAGANPAVGQGAALEDRARITEVLKGSDLVFITAGMGGGTGTGAAPVFAQIAREVGALTVGVVTKPFQFEGKKRMNSALKGIAGLRENVDVMITISNQRLLSLSNEPLSFVDAFTKADQVLLHAVQGLADMINQTGLINSDFAHVKAAMKNKGIALMGLGQASGENRAVKAAQNAITSPLLEDTSIVGATHIIINVTAGSSLSINEMNEATSLIMEAAHEDAEIIFGTVIDESLQDTVKVTVIATGLSNEPRTQNKQSETDHVHRHSPGGAEAIEPSIHEISVAEAPPIILVTPADQVAENSNLEAAFEESLALLQALNEQTEVARTEQAALQIEIEAEAQQPQAQAPTQITPPPFRAESATAPTHRDRSRAKSLAERLLRFSQGPLDQKDS